MSEIEGTDISQDPDPLETLIIGNRICGLTVLGRRSVWERAGAHDETLVFSDWDFWMRMLGVSKVGFIDEVLAEWRIHSRNTSVGIDWKRGNEYALEVLTAWRDRHFEPKHLGLINLRRSAYLFELGRLAEARASLGDAFNVNDSAAEYLAYFSRVTSAEYQRWALGILRLVSRIKTDGAYITAKPNPVQDSAEPLGKTVISWSTRDIPSQEVHVRVYTPGGGESLFALGAHGSQEAPWIQLSLPVEFRLYWDEGSSRKLLDRVVVTRQK